MVWEQRVETIVMITKLVEQGKVGILVVVVVGTRQGWLIKRLDI